MNNNINFIHKRERHNPKDALEVLPYVFKFFNPNSVLDIGCANGSWLKASKTLGIKEVIGIDGIRVDEQQMLIEKDEFVLHDLTKPLILNKKFDLAMSLEVAEHLPELAADTIVRTLCVHSDVILFSAAIPGQGGQYHINEQWPEYWHEKFKAQGFLAYDMLREKFWNNEHIFWWYRQNMILFIKKDKVLTEDFIPNQILNTLVHPELYKKKCLCQSI